MVELGEETAPAAPARAHGGLSLSAVARTWWPLAASWLLMGVELPALSAVIARLAEPRVHLAAFGAIVAPVSILIEAPIIMMLAASTAQSRDAASFRELLRFNHRVGFALTVAHASLAFTPLYDLLVVALIDPPPEIVEPGRLGLRLMTFWTWCIADRRFRQGVLIRFGHSRAITVGTVVRLLGTGSALAVLALSGLPGIAVASGAWAFGVLVEMLFVRAVAAPVIRERVLTHPGDGGALGLRGLLAFYVPLALTPSLAIAAQPIGAAAISRMPDALASLAVWPALHGAVFLVRSAGLAFNEVAVRHAGEPGAQRALARFALLLGAGCGLVLLVAAATPLSGLWFGVAVDLEPELAARAERTLWLGVLLPPLTVVHSLYQGYLVHARRTRAVTEAVALYLVASAAVLGAGVLWGGAPGLSVVLVAFTVGAALQAAWLRRRARALPAGALG